MNEVGSSMKGNWHKYLEKTRCLIVTSSCLQYSTVSMLEIDCPMLKAR